MSFISYINKYIVLERRFCTYVCILISILIRKRKREMETRGMIATEINGWLVREIEKRMP